MELQIETIIGASIQTLDAHLLKLAIDRLDGMAILTQFKLINKPGMWLHIHLADWHQTYTGLHLYGSLIGCTIEGFIPEQSTALRQVIGKFRNRCKVLQTGKKDTKAH